MLTPDTGTDVAPEPEPEAEATTTTMIPIFKYYPGVYDDDSDFDDDEIDDFPPPDDIDGKCMHACSCPNTHACTLDRG
jgi:hypothetical protein